MQDSRRQFIKKTSLAALGSPFFTNSLFANGVDSHVAFPKFGIQLWTVKEDMDKDPRGTLKALASYGYKQIESFGGKDGIFWGMSPADFKAFTHDLALDVISSHVNPAYTTDLKLEDEFKKLVDDAALVGIKHLINPFPGELKTNEDWKKVAEGLNRTGKIAALKGIKTAYHNHHIEFMPTSDGSLPETILLNNTDPNLVDFELDIYWNVKAGQNPEKWFKEHKNRFKLVHVKDLYKANKIKEIENTEKSESAFWPLGESTFLGNGQINFPKILKTAKENGVNRFIVEQERFDLSTPLKDAKKDADYMKKFKFV